MEYPFKLSPKWAKKNFSIPKIWFDSTKWPVKPHKNHPKKMIIYSNETEKIFSVLDHMLEEKGHHRRFYNVLGFSRSKILLDIPLDIPGYFGILLDIPLDIPGYSRILWDIHRYSRRILWFDLILFSFSYFDFPPPILFPSPILTKSEEKGTKQVLWPRKNKPAHVVTKSHNSCLDFINSIISHCRYIIRSAQLEG